MNRSLKRCSKCQTEKELSEFTKDRDKKDGLRTVCKPCTKITYDAWYAKEYYEYHKKLSDRLESEYKICSKCGVEKLKSEYHKDNSAFDKLRYNCKECGKQQKLLSTRDVKSYNKKWSSENPDKIRKYVTEYNSKNPHVVTFRAGLRRAMKRQATPSWVDKEHRAKIKEIYKSARISSEFHEIPFHVDHIAPLKGANEKGEHVSCGLHVWWNLRSIPAKENLKKYNKLLLNEI